MEFKVYPGMAHGVGRRWGSWVLWVLWVLLALWVLWALWALWVLWVLCALWLFWVLWVLLAQLLGWPAAAEAACSCTLPLYCQAPQPAALLHRLAHGFARCLAPGQCTHELRSSTR